MLSTLLPRHRLPLLLAALGSLALASCNNPYDLLIHDRFEQGGFNSDVDILWVVDNSSSMEDEQTDLAANFGEFISSFANVAEEGSTIEYDTILDATTAWAEFQQNQDRFLNYNMGVITTDISSTGNGNQGNVRDATGIGGVTCNDARILRPSDENVAGDFVDLINVGIAGSGDESGVLAAAFSLCKGQPPTFWENLDSRPDDDPVKAICRLVPAQERWTSGDLPPCNSDATGPFFRDGAAKAIIIASDEGDAAVTRNDLPPQAWVQNCVDTTDLGECGCKNSFFLDFFDGFGDRVVFFTITPSYQLKGEPIAWCDGGELDIPGPCNPFGAGTCALDLYQQAACESAGSYIPIQENVGGVSAEDPPSCQDLAFAPALNDIGARISNLDKGWRLSLTPDLESLTVLVDGEEITPQSERPSGGWRYIPTDNAIDFTGDSVPDFNATVDIYYLPAFDRAAQTGRPLPF